MKHTVVGLFDRRADAEKAADVLVRKGYEPSRVHLTEQSGEELVPAAAVVEGGPGLLGGRLAQMFNTLFGVDDEPHARHYQEAVRRGGTVLAVETADEVSAQAASEALTAAGAANIDDRLGEWRSGGWDSGGTEEATPRTGVEWTAERHELVSAGGVRIYSKSVARGYDDYADDFRSDYASRYASQGGSYADYEPAYRYGHGLRSDARYSGRSWEEIEPDVERDWQRSNPASPWHKFKSAVRHAWERVTS